MSEKRLTYPVNLQLKGRRCLIVGAGRVSERKVTGLLRTGAQIEVVAAEVKDEFRDKFDSCGVRIKERPFRKTDINNLDLVFAATNDPAVNRRIIRLCRENKVLCCAVDKNWPDGDFITPATFSTRGLTLSVSTDGTACKRSRMVRDNIERHVELLSDACATVIGTDFRHSSVEAREALPVFSEGINSIGKKLKRLQGLHEFVILTTCDRVEVLGFASDKPDLHELILEVTGIGALGSDKYYVLKGLDAFRHLPLVSCGLSSRNVGEKHVSGQMKTAFKEAEDKNWTGSFMHEWLGHGRFIARKLRRLIPDNQPVVELEDAVAAQVVTELDAERSAGGQILLCGTGQLGKAIAVKLAENKLDFTWLYRTSRPRSSFKCSLKPISKLNEFLSESAVAILATRSEVPLVTKSDIRNFLPDRPALILDLGVPHNVDPEIALSGYEGRLLNLLEISNMSPTLKLENPADKTNSILEKYDYLHEKLSGTF